MSKIIENALEIIGNTPMMRLSRYSEESGLRAELLAKLEYLNPAGSVKDRVGLAMIEDAEQKGLLKPGAVIIEPTSGNTGIGLAMAAAVKGYRMILTLPDTMSIERRNLLKGYGAELVLTDGAKGMTGAIGRAQELNRQIEGSVILGQFDNPANPAVHKSTTGPEIWEQTGGNIDIFVAGVWYRRDADRYRRISQRTESSYPHCGDGACGQSVSLGRKSGRSRDSGHRRGFCSVGSQYIGL